MIEKKDIRHVGVRIPEELHKPIRKRLAEDDDSLQQVILRLLRSWVEGTPDTSTSVLSDYPQKGVPPRTKKGSTIGPVNSEWILDMLKDILASGHGVAIDAITRNLYAFQILIHRDAEGVIEGYPIPRPKDLKEDLARAAERVRRAQKADGAGSPKPHRRAS